MNVASVLHLARVLFLFLAISIMNASASDNQFINPAKHGTSFDFQNDTVWKVGTEKNVTWITTFNRISLYLWQNENDTSLTLLNDVPAVTSYVFDVDPTGQFSLADGNVFYFQIVSGGGNQRFNSHYFNITDGPQHSHGLSSGAKIGIGVGAGVGGLLLLAAAAVAVFFFMRKRRASKDAEKAASWTNTSTQPSRSTSSRFMFTGALPAAHEHSSVSPERFPTSPGRSRTSPERWSPSHVNSPTSSHSAYDSYVPMQERTNPKDSSSPQELPTTDNQLELPADSQRAEMGVTAVADTGAEKEGEAQIPNRIRDGAPMQEKVTPGEMVELPGDVPSHAFQRLGGGF